MSGEKRFRRAARAAACGRSDPGARRRLEKWCLTPFFSADHRIRRSPRLLLAIAAAAALVPLEIHAQSDDTEGLDVRFLTFDYDGATGRTEFTELRISQGELSIEADKGWSMDSQRAANGGALTEYRLDGNVTLRGEGVRITGDSAAFIARDETLQRFELRGTPARFEDLTRSEAEQAFGEAERLVYDAGEGIVTLSGEARIVLGPYAYVGCDLIYEIAAQAARSGSSECEQRLQMIRMSPSEDAAGRQAP